MIGALEWGARRAALYIPYTLLHPLTSPHIPLHPLTAPYSPSHPLAGLFGYARDVLANWLDYYQVI